MEGKLKDYFNILVKIVFAFILLFIMLGMIIGVGRLFYQVYALFNGTGISGEFYKIISDVLTLFVLVELSRSLVEYFNINRIRLTFIIDGGIVFVLREVMINLFKNQLEATSILALSVLLLVLGMIRIASILVHQRETAGGSRAEETG
ncbi:MAG: hypothetical protein C0623_14175 [Desulfuromonas sp.]|nr:MAG: hypothetical protein C0623_14175 [Desulfuromonas sp.]